jgi:hypothetical protein
MPRRRWYAQRAEWTCRDLNPKPDAYKATVLPCTPRITGIQVAGFEPATPQLAVGCSIQLSYTWAAGVQANEARQRVSGAVRASSFLWWSLHRSIDHLPKAPSWGDWRSPRQDCQTKFSQLIRGTARPNKKSRSLCRTKPLSSDTRSLTRAECIRRELTILGRQEREGDSTERTASVAKPIHTGDRRSGGLFRVCPRSSANLVVPSKTFDTRSRLAIFEPTHKEFSRRSKLSGSRDYFDAISKYPTTPPLGSGRV